MDGCFKLKLCVFIIICSEMVILSESALLPWQQDFKAIFRIYGFPWHMKFFVPFIQLKMCSSTAETTIFTLTVSTFPWQTNENGQKMVFNLVPRFHNLLENPDYTLRRMYVPRTILHHVNFEHIPYWCRVLAVNVSIFSHIAKNVWLSWKPKWRKTYPCSRPGNRHFPKLQIIPFKMIRNIAISTVVGLNSVFKARRRPQPPD